MKNEDAAGLAVFGVALIISGLIRAGVFKRLWWRLTGQPTLAEYGEKVVITQRLRIGRDVHVLRDLPKVSDYFGPIPTEGKIINFVKHTPLPKGATGAVIFEGNGNEPYPIGTIDSEGHFHLPTDLDSPENKAAIREISQEAPQTPPADR